MPCVGTGGWTEFALPQPLTISADTAYTLSVSTAADVNKVFPLSLNFLTAAGGNDKSLTFTVAAGVFSTQLGTRPTQTAQNAFYFRDVVFATAMTMRPTVFMPKVLSTLPSRSQRFRRSGQSIAGSEPAQVQSDHGLE